MYLFEGSFITLCIIPVVCFERGVLQRKVDGVQGVSNCNITNRNEEKQVLK